MDEHDPIIDQDFPETRRRLRELGSAPLAPGLADRVFASVRSAGRPKVSRGRLKLLSAAAMAGFVAGGVGLAAADVLPAPVQDMAHGALDAVGVHVPPGHVRYNDPVVCPGGPYRNHGAYVRAHKSDPNAGNSPCGKPVQSVNPNGGAKDTKEPNDATDPKDPKDANGNDNKGQGAGNGSSPGRGHGKPDKNGAASTVPAKKPDATTPSSTTASTTTNAPTTSTTTSTTGAPTSTTSTTQP